MIPQRPMNPNDPQAGVSLIAAMITLGVLIVLALAINQRYIQTTSSLKNDAIIADYQDMQNYVRGVFDCTATMATEATACKAHGNIQLKSRSLATPNLIANPTGGEGTTQGGQMVNTYTTMGQYSLRARCIPCSTCPNNARVVVEYSARSGETTRINPLTHKAMGWADLFPVSPLVCNVP